MSIAPAVTLRPAGPADDDALARLADLDSRPLPPGPHLVAERGGAPAAALSLATGEIIANPFEPTAPLRDLLRLHARSMVRGEASRAPRRLRAHPIPLTA